MPSVLVVEADAKLRAWLALSLKARGFAVAHAGTGHECLTVLKARHPDLLMLDLSLPDMDGLELIGLVRETWPTPLIVVSARQSSSDRVSALEAGADDFVGKPFDLEELVARIRAGIRRTQARRQSESVDTVAFRLDFAGMIAVAGGKRVRLTPKEWRLMAALTTNAGQVVQTAQLLEAAWGAGYADQVHYLRIYMSQLRRKLEPDPSHPVHIITVAGVGYRFDP